MRLTIEAHSESLKRFGHLKRARGWKHRACAASCPGSARLCTRDAGHSGPHVSHGFFGKLLAVWESGGDAGRPRRATATDTGSAVRPRRGPKRPIGLRSRSPVGFIETLQGLVARAISSAEELAFLVFFLTFVAFAIGGFLLIYLG